MQGTYQYWGARIFTLLYVGIETTFGFQMRVNDAARLWINNTLVIDATCRSLTCNKLHLFSPHFHPFGRVVRHLDDLTACLCLLLCIRHLPRTTFYTYSHSTGTQNGTQSTANSNYLWNGTIYLRKGDINMTVEYHNGNGGGALTLGGDIATNRDRGVSAQ